MPALTGGRFFFLAIVPILFLAWRLLFSNNSSDPSTSYSLNLPKFNATDQTRICIQLSTTLPELVYSKEHPVYQKALKTPYAAQAQEERPSCITQPNHAEDVSLTLKVLKAAYDAKDEVRFAVRSGGHHPGSGHSSIEGGVLIDLSLINEVTVSQDRESVVIGSGARWGRVYDKLDGIGLSVAGGRNADVGVGGLTLGGGISYFSPQVGMVCDNILEYEIVLADGTIVTATQSNHPDLWKSLKGGSGNFGVVTRFTARTFAVGKIWGGAVYYTYGKVAQLIDAFHEFNKVEVFDQQAASPILSLNYVDVLPFKLLCVNMIYTKPEKWPKVFSGFKEIWPRLSLTGIRPVADAANQLTSTAPPGKRQHYVTLTVKNDLGLLQALPAIFDRTAEKVKRVKGIVWTIVMQPLPATITHKGDPNVLGLESRNISEPTPISIMMPLIWKLASDDALVKRVGREFYDEIRALSIARGSADDYLYINYASDYSATQDPFSSYGEANRAFLQKTSVEYDPDRFFQIARAGGFKLDI